MMMASASLTAVHMFMDRVAAWPGADGAAPAAGAAVVRARAQAGRARVERARRAKSIATPPLFARDEGPLALSACAV